MTTEPLNMTRHMGKRPATYSHRDFIFEKYRLGQTLPMHPRTFGHEQLIKRGQWQMLGNDAAGNCVFAGADHETLLLNAEAGRQVIFTDSTALADYSEVTGYNPSDPSTDQGTDVRKALAWRRRRGVLDFSGNRHKIGAFISLEPKNFDSVLEAMWLCGVVGIGFECPDSALDQFNSGQAWTVRPGASIIGGHYVPLVAVRGHYLECVTWGRVQRMSRAFFETYCDEAWAILSPEMLTNGKSPEGFSMQTLMADLQALLP